MDDFELDKLVAAVKENLTNKTFLVGLENLAKAMSDPDMYAKAYFKQMIGTVVPNIVSQGANWADPYARHSEAFGMTGGVPDIVASRVPGMSQQLPLRYSSTGEALMRPQKAGEQTFGPVMRGLSPFNVGPGEPPPERELERVMDNLKDYDGVPPPLPKRSRRLNMGFGRKQTVKLTEEEFGIHIKFRQMATDLIRDLVAKPSFQEMPEFLQARVISRIYRKLDSNASSMVNMMLRKRVGNSLP
jgi:hypothetical protein